MHVFICLNQGSIIFILLSFFLVTASWKEPMPGWVDNMNGPTGMLAGAGKGVLRTLMCHREKVADLIPVDMAINLMITVAWHLATTRSDHSQER